MKKHHNWMQEPERWLGMQMDLLLLVRIVVGWRIQKKIPGAGMMQMDHTVDSDSDSDVDSAIVDSVVAAPVTSTYRMWKRSVLVSAPVLLSKVSKELWGPKRKRHKKRKRPR